MPTDALARQGREVILDRLAFIRSGCGGCTLQQSRYPKSLVVAVKGRVRKLEVMPAMCPIGPDASVAF
jgi:hypothetical protein